MLNLNLNLNLNSFRTMAGIQQILFRCTPDRTCQLNARLNTVMDPIAQVVVQSCFGVIYVIPPILPHPTLPVRLFVVTLNSEIDCYSIPPPPPPKTKQQCRE